MLRLRIWSMACLGGLLATSALAELSAEQRRALADHFGFQALQTYRFERAVTDLAIGDLDGDNRKDIVVFNGYLNRLELLFQPNPDKPRSRPSEALKQNELPDRGNLIIEPLPVAYRVGDLKVGDVTNDGRNDIVFFGEPKELVVLANKGNGEFAAPVGIRAPEGDPVPDKLVLADLNHDGLTDAALLGSAKLLIFHQQAGGQLTRARAITHNIPQPLLLRSGDVDADGRADLIVSSDDEQAGLYLFLQDESGQLGPLRRIAVPNVRDVRTVPSSADDGHDLLVIESATDRLIRYEFAEPTKRVALPDWPTLFYSYPVESDSKRVAADTGDIDRDGRADLVVADPDAARLMLFTQGEDGLTAGTSFPGLKDVIDVQIIDANGDQQPDVLSVSPAEKMIGLSQFKADRLTFPQAIDTRGDVAAAQLGRFVPGGGLNLAYVTRIEQETLREKLFAEDERDAEAYLIVANPMSGAILQYVPIDELRDDPRGMRWADVNQDGLHDVLVFFDFAPLMVFLQQSQGGFAQFVGADKRDGLVKDVRLSATTFVDIDGDDEPEMVSAYQNIARALTIRDDQWTVIDQINPPQAGARLTGLAALPIDNKLTLAAYDQRFRVLRVFQRDARETFTESRTIPLGAFDISRMTTLPAGENAAAHALVIDADKVALLKPQSGGSTLVQRETYTSDDEEAWLSETANGDVNDDGVRDIVVIDARQASLELLTTLPSRKWARVHRFQVFEGKRFSDEPDYSGEPREIGIADLTGDGVDDIIMLVHDRIIIYPGE